MLYDSIASGLVQGGPYVDADGYRSRRAPAFPFLLAGVYAVAGHSWPAARVAQAILSALTCNVLLGLGASMFGARIGVTAALSCAVFPYTVFYSGSLTSEPLCALLTTAAALALTRAPGGMGWTAAWSILCGLTTLTRPNLGLLLPLGLAWLLGVSRRRWATMAFGVFCLVLLPWTIRNYLVHRRIVPVTTMGGVVLWQGNNPIVAADPELRGQALPGDPAWQYPASLLSEVDQDSYFLHRALEFMRESPSIFPGLIGCKFLRLWNLFPRLDSRFQRWLAPLTLLPVMLLFGASLVVAWIDRDARVLPLLTPVLTVILTAVIFWADARIRSPADPVILLVASYGARSLIARRRRRIPEEAGVQQPLL
jgi:4-amino-4-deoxy-L-arabinose transferase-like glycosyltransferase